VVDASRSVEGSKIGHNYCLLCSKMLEQMAGSTSTKLLYVFRMIVESNVRKVFWDASIHIGRPCPSDRSVAVGSAVLKKRW
jgi:hypothetical protein